MQHSALSTKLEEALALLDQFHYNQARVLIESALHDVRFEEHAHQHEEDTLAYLTQEGPAHE